MIDREDRRIEDRGPDHRRPKRLERENNAMKSLVGDGERTAILFMAARGVSRTKIARRYRLDHKQVTNMINTHRAEYNALVRQLEGAGRPPATTGTSPKKPAAPEPGAPRWQQCLKCRQEFLGAAFIRVCSHCKTKKSWKEGNDFQTPTVQRRGAQAG